MKRDRLYALTLYLLNHGRASARELADHFEVSTRTIQRDIDALGRAGVPVESLPGRCGGYALVEGFRMERQLLTPEDRANLRAAMAGLASATGDPSVGAGLEKLMALSPEADSDVVLDFSALRERDQAALAFVRRAIALGRAVRFDYTNARGERRDHEVEPVAAVYRWYAWYLLAHSARAQDYRLYKLARMERLELAGAAARRHPSPREILARMPDDSRPCAEIVLRCDAASRGRALEYLNADVLEELPGGGARLRFCAPEEEHFWLGTVLALGGGVEIERPESKRAQVLEAARTIVVLYSDEGKALPAKRRALDGAAEEV